MYTELKISLDELLACNAFELHKASENGTDYYIPYMMNDALECYFVLRDCQLTGNLPKQFQDVKSVELIESEGTPALLLRQTDGSVATLWFSSFQKELKCYRYHEIGHFWVKGQEQWRQLVYMIGTIYDKYVYMGSHICNDVELELLPLMEFAPFRYWSPIHESLDAYYPDTPYGLETIQELCRDAGDRKLLRYLTLSSFLPRSLRTKLLGEELARAGHEKLYESIYQKVCLASSAYPSRAYASDIREHMELSRVSVSKEFYDLGCSGTYPHFQKGNVSILVTEEHPFVISDLEYENYGFRMQFMVSECNHRPQYLNEGFFRKKGNSSKIVKSVKEIL